MKGKTIVACLLLILLCFCPGVFAGQQQFPELSSIAVVVYDADLDQVLYEKNAYQSRSIASLTKIMTMLYICELVEAGKIKLDEQVTASANAASRGGTQINLKSGDKFTVEELLYAAALASANDASVALAEYVAGSEREFAKLMTKRAHELGLKNSNYVDSTGLLSIYSGNYSTAYDMAILSKIAMENPLFRKLVSTKEYGLKAQGRTIRNSNALLHDVLGVDGIKTGATTPAGHTLITSAVRHGRRLIVVVLGAPSREVRNEESKQLLEYAYANLEVLIPAGTHQGQGYVSDGVSHLIDVVTAEDFSLFVFNEEMRKFDTRVELQKLRAPIDKGDKIGELIIIQNEQEIAAIDLVSNTSTGLASFIRRLWNNLVGLISRLWGGD